MDQNLIESDKVVLKTPLLEKPENFLSLITSPAYSNMSPLTPLSYEAALKTYEVLIKNHDLNLLKFWSVWDKTKNEYAGFLGYMPIVLEKKREEMLFVGFNLQYWESRLALESIRLVLNYAFHKNNISKIVEVIHPENNVNLQCATEIPSKFEKEIEFYGGSAFLYSVEKNDFALNATIRQ